MVQFIPSAQGTTPWAPHRPSLLEQIGPVLGQLGQAMGAPDASGNMQGVAAILQALQGQKSLNDLIGMHRNQAPIRGPAGYTPPGAGDNAVPAGAIPPAPPSPFGPLGDVSMNRLKSIQDTVGKTGVSGILGNMSSTTLYMDPSTGALSFNATPGAVPISGYKGPAAATAVQHSRHQKLMDDHTALMDKLKTANVDTLSAEDKRWISIARINAQALANPLADFSDQDQAVMRDAIKHANDILSRSSGAGTKKTSGAKKRVKVRGPKGETGTIEQGDQLPAGWQLDNG